MISIGEAPNAAAKLSELWLPHELYATSQVVNALNSTAKTKLDRKTAIWINLLEQTIGGKRIPVRGTTYWRDP